MRIGVNEVVDEYLLQVNIVQPACYFGPADAGSLDRCEVVDLDTGDVLQRQHAAGGVVPEDIGDVDPGIIREVMAPASGLSSEEAPLPVGSEDELWRRLGLEQWLVSRRGNVLRHRPEVRRSMLDLMRQQDPVAFARTNALALDAFRKRADQDLDARAETIYHLLLGGGRLEDVEEFWSPSVGPLLSSAVDDLDARGQGYLKAKLGRSVPIDTLASFPAPILLSMLSAFGPRYLRRLGPDGLLQVLDSAREVGGNPVVGGLRCEALYRSGRWEALREAADAEAGAGPVDATVALLWQGNFERLAGVDEPTQAALRFLLRWATRDPGADLAWTRGVEQFSNAVTEPGRVLAMPNLGWDFATLVACGGSGSRALPFAPHHRDEMLRLCGELCRSQARLPDAAAGSDALRILAFFEPGPDRPILRRVDFDNHFATISGREIQALRDLVEVRIAGPDDDPAARSAHRDHDQAIKRARTLLGRLKGFPEDVVIADAKLTREFAAVVRDVVEAGADRPARAALRTLALKHPDWLQPLGHALTRAFGGDVPRRIGWWATIDRYLGSGDQPRKARDQKDGQSILARADEASSLTEAVAAYERLLLDSDAEQREARNFLALAQAFTSWVQMIDETLEDPRYDASEGNMPRKSSAKAPSRLRK